MPCHALPPSRPAEIKGVNAFQQLLLLQSLRPDRLESAMLCFASEVLGKDVVSQAAPSLARVYEETVMSEPILLITTPGSDPSVELEDFALRQVQLQYSTAQYSTRFVCSLPPSLLSLPPCAWYASSSSSVLR